jgi:hypothetical protein
MYLKRRRWLSDRDGWIIGRVLESPLAAAGVARVYDSLLRNSANSAAAFPECGLPFEGVTRWQARGVWISRGKGKGFRFLIYELLRCSAPFPFRELHVDADNNGDPAEDPDKDLPEEEKRPAWASPSKVAKPDPNDELQSHLPPDANIGTVQILQVGDRFDDIAGKEIIRAPKEQCRYKSVALRRPQGLAALGTGESVRDDNAIAPLRSEWEMEPVRRRESLPASFESLQAVVDALNRLDGVTAHIRPPTSNTEFLRPIGPSSRRQWAYLDSAHRIRRRVMVIDIACEGVLGCLVEHERRESEHSRVALFVARESSEIPEVILIRLLDGLVVSRGIWANLKSYPDAVVLKKLFNHSRPSADAFATDLYNAMKKTA